MVPVEQSFVPYIFLLAMFLPSVAAVCPLCTALTRSYSTAVHSKILSVGGRVLGCAMSRHSICS